MTWSLTPVLCLMLGCLPSFADDFDKDGSASHDDCDDLNASVYPGAPELCDGLDNDCDKDVDEDPVDGLALHPDADADGFGASDTTVHACQLQEGLLEDASDCDDADETVNPTRDEICGGGDEDCSGAIDDDAVDASTWYLDLDSDGYGDASQTVQACGQPDDAVADATDCDDSAPSTHPNAAEIPYDNLDNDCNGGDLVDVDGDGFDATVVGGDDCDDDDGSVHPGVFEWTTDSIDSDCDGDPDVQSTYHAVELTGDAGSRLGATLGPAGDLDGDGLPDLAVGATGDAYGGSGAGAVWIVRGGAAAGDIAESAVRLSGVAAGDAAGTALAAAGDINGDGYDDLAVGAPSAGDAGSMYIVYGPVTTDTSLSAADLEFPGLDVLDLTGSAVVSLGDIDGDGTPDLGLGAPGVDVLTSYEETDEGAVYLLTNVASARTLDGASMIVTGVDRGDGVGRCLVNGGDLNGDGVDDLAIGVTTHGAYPGLVAVFLGPTSKGGTIDDADFLIAAEAEADLGTVIAAPADLDRDGYADLALSDALYPSWATGDPTEAGAVHLWFGSESAGDLYSSTAPSAIIGDVEGLHLGSSIAAPGDVDGDGEQDLLIGASGSDAGTGKSFLFSGRIDGTRTSSSADAIFQGAAPDGEFGAALTVPGDLDATGRLDFVVGAPGADKGAGSVYTYNGP